MQKYKKWKQVLSVSTAVSLCIAGAGSLMGCGSTDRGKDKADSVESKAMGRYLENELSVPLTVKERRLKSEKIWMKPWPGV